MSATQVSVAVRLRAKPESLEEVKRELLNFVPLTQQEPGCIAFDLHQSLDDPCQLRFCELWESRAALDEHLQRPYIQAFFQKADTVLGEPMQISLWRMISTPK